MMVGCLLLVTRYTGNTVYDRDHVTSLWSRIWTQRRSWRKRLPWRTAQGSPPSSLWHGSSPWSWDCWKVHTQIQLLLSPAAWAESHGDIGGLGIIHRGQLFDGAGQLLLLKGLLLRSTGDMFDDLSLLGFQCSR